MSCTLCSQCTLKPGSIQPGPLSTLSLVLQVGQAWKANQQKGAANRPFCSILLICMFENVLKMREQPTKPPADQSQEPTMASGGSMAVPDLVSISGCPDSRWLSGPLSTQEIIQMIRSGIPLLFVPHMVKRFHANTAFKESTKRVTAFQLEVSKRTDQCQTVWKALETLAGSTLLQLIGVQLRRDNLRQSPAAELIQTIIYGSSD